MKILQIIPGIARSVLGRRARFQEIIKNSQFSHIVISTPDENAIKGKINREESGQNFIIKEAIGSKLLEKRGAYWLTWPLFRIHIFFEVIKFKVSVIHIHNVETLSIAGGWVARYLGVPLIHEIHELWASSLNKKNHSYTSFPNKFIKRILRHEKWLIENSRQLIVQTKIMASELMQIYKVPKEHILVLGNKIDTNHLNAELYQKERKQLRKRWSISDNEVVFLYPGYINRFNGINELLSAFEAIKDKSSMRLIIFGDGELREEVINSAALNKRINYFGTVKPVEMPGIYAASDCVIMARPDCPETREATPMKLLEAMSMSRLVICSMVKGLTRICNDQTGLIVAPGNIDELSEAIEYVSRNFSQLGKMRLQAREHIVKLMQQEDPSKVLDFIYKKVTCD